ncbi:MAG: hypothetical protein AB7S38_30980 [Vulcanimicrobiota bacterium]
MRLLLTLLYLTAVVAAEPAPDKQVVEDFYRLYLARFDSAREPAELEEFLSQSAYERFSQLAERPERFQHMKLFLPKEPEVVEVEPRGERVLVTIRARVPEPRQFKLMPATGRIELLSQDGWKVDREVWTFGTGETP